MEIDNKCIKIINVLYKNEKFLTIYEITKKLYPKIKYYRKLSDLSSPVRQRINKLKQHKFLIEKKRKDKRFYGLNKKNIIFSEKSILKIESGEKFDFDNVFLIKENGFWRFEQLTTY